MVDTTVVHEDAIPDFTQKKPGKKVNVEDDDL
jgi:hypothetical protein